MQQCDHRMYVFEAEGEIAKGERVSGCSAGRYGEALACTTSGEALKLLQRWPRNPEAEPSDIVITVARVSTGSNYITLAQRSRQ